MSDLDDQSPDGYSERELKRRSYVVDLNEVRVKKAEEKRRQNPNFEKWREWCLYISPGGGPPPGTLENAVAILENDPEQKGRMWKDAFLQRILTGDPPREWGDVDDIALVLYIQRVAGLPKIGKEIVSQAVVNVAHTNERNCVTDWMDSLVHDGTPRLDLFLSDCLGAEDSEYSRAASRNFWLSMVARAYHPGCKVDNMLVLEGAQGVGKSTALQIIGGDWFAEQHESATNPKAFAEILQGKLLVEISEMDSFNRSEVNRVKQTVTCVSDRFRASYGRYAQDHPRTCIFVGTTNRDDWNRDETGARRFWPITCGDINLEAIRENRDQLFAEAIARAKSGEPHWLMPAEHTQREQDARYQSDPWEETVRSYCDVVGQVKIPALLTHLGLETSKHTRSDQMRVGAILRRLGFGRARQQSQGTREYVYAKVVEVGQGGAKI